MQSGKTYTDKKGFTATVLFTGVVEGTVPEYDECEYHVVYTTIRGIFFTTENDFIRQYPFEY